MFVDSHKITGLEFPEDSREYKLRKMMCRLWANFARFGDPTPNDDTTSTAKWYYTRSVDKHADKVIVDYLKIDNDEVKMHKDLYKKRIDFWRGVYEEYNKSFLNPKFPVKI